MPKQLLIFGNGLGRSIDNDFYSLTRVLQESWADRNVVDEVQKRLICACLDNGVIENDLQALTEEEQLANLQKVLNACDIIARFEERVQSETGWLNEHGQQFPIAIRRYIHDAASRFHDNEMFLPPAFAASLREFVEHARPHIATLNYDDLLYECFTGTPAFTQHMLRDGFFGGSFNFGTHQERMDLENEGWFLHLHGSPLFVNRNGQPGKIRRSRLNDFQGNSSTHLVLTNASSKPAVISGSEILSTYWKELRRILDQPLHVTVLGYGGGDLHLNDLLGRTSDRVRIRVVCRATDYADPVASWRRTFEPKTPNLIDVVAIENLVEFGDWSVG